MGRRERPNTIMSAALAAAGITAANRIDPNTVIKPCDIAFPVAKFLAGKYGNRVLPNATVRDEEAAVRAGFNWVVADFRINPLAAANPQLFNLQYIRPAQQLFGDELRDDAGHNGFLAFAMPTPPNDPHLKVGTVEHGNVITQCLLGWDSTARAIHCVVRMLVLGSKPLKVTLDG
jgi:hypothetical protein